MNDLRDREGVFKISISDGWCEYSFELNAGGHFSIVNIKERISKSFPNKKQNTEAPLIREE